MRAEARVAKRNGMKWQERGPPGPYQGGPTTWRSQPFRKQSRKWMKRGGTKQEYFKQKFGKHRLGYFSRDCAQGNSSTARGIALLLLHKDLTLHM